MSKMNKRAAAMVGVWGLGGAVLGVGAVELAATPFENDPYVELVNATKCSEQLGESAVSDAVVLPENCEDYSFDNHRESTQVFDGYSDKEGVEELKTTYVLPGAEEFLDSESDRIENSRNDIKRNLKIASAAIFGFIGLGLGAENKRKKAKKVASSSYQ